MDVSENVVKFGFLRCQWNFVIWTSIHLLGPMNMGICRRKTLLHGYGWLVILWSQSEAALTACLSCRWVPVAAHILFQYHLHLRHMTR